MVGGKATEFTLHVAAILLFIIVTHGIDPNWSKAHGNWSNGLMRICRRGHLNAIAQLGTCVQNDVEYGINVRMHVDGNTEGDGIMLICGYGFRIFAIKTLGLQSVVIDMACVHLFDFARMCIVCCARALH